MTVLSPEALTNFLDLIEDGASVSEASAAIGCAPRSKVAFKWIADSSAAAEFDAPPDPLSPWCVTRGDRLEWFHILYEQARANRRANRAVRVSPLRRDLEEKLAARRADPTPSRPEPSPLEADLRARIAAKRAGQVATVTPSFAEQQAPPRVIIERVTRGAVSLDPPPPKPKPRPIKQAAPRIEGAHSDDGPPHEGRFLMAADKPKSIRERMAGTLEITDAGVRRW